MTAVNLATADLFQAEIARLQAEIDRLRLTDAEREALEQAVAFMQGSGWSASTLRGLLQRMETVKR